MSTQSDLNTVAVFGCTGQIGSAIIDALLDPPTHGYTPIVHAFIEPGKDLPKAQAQNPHLRLETVDFEKGGDELVQHLRGIDAVVSALNGPALKTQYTILEAAIKAGALYLYGNMFDVKLTTQRCRCQTIHPK
jgi:saccharopine dehydrogenase-like NADP-dependent oxidoreductase